MSARSSTIQMLSAGLVPALGAPQNVKPATASGEFTGQITAAATPEKVLSASMDTGRSPRRCLVYNPSTTEWLSWTILGNGATAVTMSAGAAGAATRGMPIPPQAQLEVIVPHNCELWLAAEVDAQWYLLAVAEKV